MEIKAVKAFKIAAVSIIASLLIAPSCRVASAEAGKRTTKAGNIRIDSFNESKKLLMEKVYYDHRPTIGEGQEQEVTVHSDQGSQHGNHEWMGISTAKPLAILISAYKPRVFIIIFV